MARPQRYGWSEPSCAAEPSSTTSACRRRRLPAYSRNPSPSCRRLGRCCIARGLDRGAINLPIPEQELEPDDGGWRLTLRAPIPAEDWNAQISLLTGMCAADIMLAGRVGLLRTMPAPRPEAVTRAACRRRRASAWTGRTAVPVGRLLASIDPAVPRGAALVDQAAELLRGAGYTALDGGPPRTDRPRRRRRAVRARDRAAAAPGRPLRDRGVPEPGGRAVRFRTGYGRRYRSCPR